MLYDHMDLRVTDLRRVRKLYDAIMPALGFSRIEESDTEINYHRPEKDHSQPFFGLMLESDHCGNASRIAFRAGSREEIDSIARLAESAGALAFEPPEVYDPEHPYYYATFFEDADGNKLEVCYRE